MSKILVISDSHGNHAAVSAIISREKPFDYLVHCGDGVYDLFHVKMPDGAAVVGVGGNVDAARGMDVERRKEFTVGDVLFMVVHGDQHRVREGYGVIEREGRGGKADVVLFGHTHVQYRSEGKPALFNPGPAVNGEYGVISMNGDIGFRHCRLGK
jgi:uncharacterized protein